MYDQIAMNKFMQDVLGAMGQQPPQGFQGNTGANVSYAQDPLMSAVNGLNGGPPGGGMVPTLNAGQPTGGAPLQQIGGSAAMSPSVQTAMPVPTAQAPGMSAMGQLSDMALAAANTPIDGSQGPLMPAVPERPFGTTGAVPPPSGAFVTQGPTGEVQSGAIPAIKISIIPQKGAQTKSDVRSPANIKAPLPAASTVQRPM